MHKLSRSLFAGFLAMGALVACDDVTPPDPIDRVTSVTVVPENVQLTVGGTATLAATVVGDAGLQDRTVTWSSSNTAIATVDANGTVTGRAAGQTTILAASVADPNVRGAASVVVLPISVPSVSIASITKGGLPVDINNVQGQVDVTLNIAGNNAAVNGVRLLVQCPNNTAPVEVQGQDFSGGTAPNGPITLSFNSAAMNAGGTAAQFQNGACQIIARLLTPSGQPTAQDTVRPVVFNNVDIVSATISSARGPAADAVGNPWRGGDVTVRVTPLIFSGATPATVTVTLTGTDTDGTAVSRSQTVSGPFPANVVFPASGTGVTNIDNLTVPTLTVTASTSGANNIIITNNSTPNNVFSLDTEDPTAGTYAFNTQNTQNFWVGTAFAFNSAAGNGYAAGTTPPGGNDWGGVDRVTVVFEAAPINSNTQVCTSAQSGLTFTAVTSGSNLNSSQVNGIAPNQGPSYCLRMREIDALQNERTTFLGIFGVDREPPRFIQSGFQDTPNQSIYDANGVDEVADAFIVRGTTAAAAAAVYAFTLRDTLSGFDLTPVNYSITRLTTTTPACVIGSGTSCAPVDSTQSVVQDSTDRTARIPITGLSAVEGYYTFNGTIRDQAANSGASALPTRMALLDATAPTVTRTGANVPGGGFLGNTTAQFNFDATDAVDLYLASAALAYPAATIRSANQQIGTPFDNVLTTAVTGQTVSFANFYRTLSSAPGAAGARPTSISVRVIDAATNETAGAPRAIDPQDVAGPNPPTFTFGAASVGVQSFTVVSAQSGTAASPNCTAGTACTITVRVQGASGTFENPFVAGGVNLYMVNGAGELVLLSPTPNTAGAQTDNGVNRFYTYTFTTTTPAAGPFTVQAIGFNGSGDALLSNAFPVTVTAP
jgi:hypothetical protein